MFNLATFLAEVCIILAATRVAGWVFQRFNQPQIIGEMTAGLLLGPFLLGWLAPEMMITLFPQRSLDYLNAVSQVGLLLYMFVVGLKLDTEFLREQKHTVIIISISSILCPFFLGFLVAAYLHPKLSSSNIPRIPFALFIGTALSVTAFPVLARILSERNILRTKIGSVSIACAAVTDITAWLLLAAVTIYAQAFNEQGGLWLTLAGLAVYFNVMWLCVRPMLRPLQRYHHGVGQITQGAMTIILLLLLGSAWATEWLGVHALFGAFFAGCVMPKGGELVRELSERVEHLTATLMLPIFFALTGLRTVVSLVSGAEVWFSCALILIAAVVGKLGGAMISARLAGMPWREAGAIGVLMNTRGLIELVILNIGFDLGLISAGLFSVMVLVALVTTFMTSPLLALIYPTRLYTRE
jgi:Kef-type K+ transport system membrane component KefB